MKKIKLKNNSKKRFNFKIFKFLFLISVFSLSFVLTSKHLLDESDINSEEYLNYFLNKSYGNDSNNFVIKESIKLFSKVDLDNPESLLDKKIKNTNNEKKEQNIKQEKDATMGEDNYEESVYDKVTTFIQYQNNTKENPIVYLYNSHQLETYSNIGLENNGIMPNVLMTSYLLSENLNKNGISTIVEDTNISEFIKISNLDSDSFYASTRIFLKNIMSKYPSLKYFIDIHRDSVDKDISYTKINDKGYARILFVLGTTNPNYEENEKIMLKLDELSDKYYPNLSRGIFHRPTPDWPDSYNQDLNNNIILIEVGGVDNTIEEVSNTTDALSDIIVRMINGE